MKADLDNLQRSLASAEATPDGPAFLLGLAPVYESGRRFAAKLGNMAKDPIGPIRELARDTLQAVGAKLHSLVDQLVTGWRSQVETAALAQVGALIDAAFAPGSPSSLLVDLLLQLPLVGQECAAYRGEVKDRLRDFAKAAVRTAIIEPKTPIALHVQELTKALNEIAARAEADGEVAASDAISSIGSAVALEAGKGVEGLAGPLYASLFEDTTGYVKQVRTAAENVVRRLVSIGPDAFDKLGMAIGDALATLDSMAAAAEVLAQAPSFCDELLASLLASIRDFADPQPLEDLVTRLRSYASSRSGSHADAPTTSLDAVLTDYRRGFDMAKASLGNAHAACVKTQDLPAQPIAALIRARVAALRPLFEIAAALREDVPVPSAGTPGVDRGAAAAGRVLVAAMRRTAGLDAGPPEWIPGARKQIDRITAAVAAKSYRDGLELGLLAPARTALAHVEAASHAAILVLDKADATFSDAAATLDDLRADYAALAALANADSLGGVIAASNPAIERLFGFTASARADLGEALNDAILATVRPAARLLDTVYSAAVKARADLVAEALGKTPSSLQTVVGSTLGAILVVAPPAGRNDGLDLTNDHLVMEGKTLANLATLPTRATDRAGALASIEALASGWRQHPPALASFARQIERAVAAAMRGDVAQFLDVRSALTAVEALVRQLVPSRIRRSYDFRIETEGLPPLLTFGKSHKKGAIVIAASGEVDLLRPEVAPRFDVEGSIDPFIVKLLPAFDVATLHFKKATFAAGTGRASAFKIDIETVELGEKVKFIRQLQSYIGAPKDGSGFYIQASSRRLGLVAGYRIALPPFNLGNLGFSNVSLNCACDLPFGDGDAQFLISLGTPEARVLVAAAPYAGTAYIALLANARGICAFEMAIEYGGGGVFSFGPLTGEGRITAGIFVRNVEGYTSLYGLFYAGGSARIACFSTSSSFCVRLGQTPNGDLSGSAVYTFSFSLGFVDVSFAITVWKTESSGNGREARSDAFRRTRYAQAGSATANDATPIAASTPSSENAPKIRLKNLAVCQSEHWGRYASYFHIPSDVETLA